MVSLRAEQVDNNAVADTRSDHEEDVEETVVDLASMYERRAQRIQ